jgi:hypothetical protein
MWSYRLSYSFNNLSRSALYRRSVSTDRERSDRSFSSKTICCSSFQVKGTDRYPNFRKGKSCVSLAWTSKCDVVGFESFVLLAKPPLLVSLTEKQSAVVPIGRRNKNVGRRKTTRFDSGLNHLPPKGLLDLQSNWWRPISPCRTPDVEQVIGSIIIVHKTTRKRESLPGTRRLCAFLPLVDMWCQQ